MKNKTDTEDKKRSKREGSKNRNCLYRINKNKDKKQHILPREGYIYEQKLRTDDKSEVDKAIRMIRGNKALNYIPTEKYIHYRERVNKSREEKKRKQQNERIQLRLATESQLTRIGQTTKEESA